MGRLPKHVMFRDKEWRIDRLLSSRRPSAVQLSAFREKNILSSNPFERFELTQWILGSASSSIRCLFERRMGEGIEFTRAPPTGSKTIGLCDRSARKDVWLRVKKR